MRYDHEAMMLVKAELCERLESLTAMSHTASAADFAQRVDGMRSLAAAYGLTPVARLAEALEHAVGKNGRNLRACPTALYLGRLHDAIGCEAADERTAQAMLASVSVRL